MNIAHLRNNVLLLVIVGVVASAAPARIPVGIESLNNKLVEAVRDGRSSAVTDLLNDGASPNAKDGVGNPVLMLSAVYAPASVMQLLLDRGADPNAVNAARASALHWSAGDPKARMLILKGANVNARSGPGRTPLAIAAAQDGNFDIVKLMVERGAEVETHDDLEGFLFTGGGKDTPLIEAAKTHDVRTVRYLLDHGAKVNATNNTGATALTEASLRGSVDIARLLIERGADVNHTTNAPFELAPIHLAAIRGSAPLIELLLSHGAQVNAKDGTGATPLMWAAYSDRLETAAVSKLLAAGAQTGHKNKMGETAMTFASRRGATPVVALLEKAGAKVETNEVTTPAASDNQYPEIRDAIARSLTVLDKGGPQFFKTSGCISCHNQTLPLMTSALARRARIEPNADVEKQQMKFILAFAGPATEIMAENSDILPDLAVTGPYILMALAAQNQAPDATTAALVHNIAAHQMKDGSWTGWAPRPPMESGDIQATALGLRALQLYGPAGRKAEFDARIAHAREWLKHATPVTTEEKAMRVFGLAWAKASRSDISAAATVLLREQREDGGWAQLPALPSDAYATGKVLVALHEAARISSSVEMYTRGVEFLRRSQQPDGSWIVKTRSFPFQPLKESGFPHGRDQWISAAGTSWAAMALAYSVEPL